MATRQVVHDVWPAGQDHLRPIVTTCYLVSVAVLSALLSRRWLSWNQLKRLPVAKLMVLAVLADSLLFVFASAVLVLGVGTSFSDVACRIGIWWCIMLYASSKILIYSFLSEKLYAVYSVTPTKRIPRWKSTQYKIAIAFLVLWLGVAIVMIIGRIAEIRKHDQACVIGLKVWATVPMLATDVVVNLYLTAAFVLPVYRSRWHKAQSLALHSCIAAIVSLITSFGNIFILTLQHGHQLSWVCLGSCGLDVTINAVILYLVTSGASSSHNSIDDYAVGNNHPNGNNKTGPSQVRSTGGGFVGRQSNLFSNSFSSPNATTTRPVPPPFQNVDSFESLSSPSSSPYAFEPKEPLHSPLSKEEEEEEKHHLPTLPSTPPSLPPSPNPLISKKSSTSSLPSGGGLAGIHVSEEIVRVEETSLDQDLEWSKYRYDRTRRSSRIIESQSSPPARVAARDGQDLVLDDMLPKIEFR